LEKSTGGGGLGRGGAWSLARGERDARENCMKGGVGDLFRQGGVREKQWGVLVRWCPRVGSGRGLARPAGSAGRPRHGCGVHGRAATAACDMGAVQTGEVR
jgi:hypothetical protein